jgi:uncharacterized membrane protein YgaE (UPF0421/DUF939 family)
MSTSLVTRAADEGLAAVLRLRAALWPIIQTSVAAGLAWYLTNDVLHHRQPFFAPISAVVCMSASNVLRARRAAQMMTGVALGIVLGGWVQAVLGTEPAAIAVAVFIALCVAVLVARGFIGQGLMFVNQTAVSAILVLVFAHGGLVVTERLFDALVGGGLALAFSMLLFPADPVAILCTARGGLLTAVHDVLAQMANIVSDPASAPPDWPMPIVDRLHQQLGTLIEVRETADLIARRAPRRWTSRDKIRDIDQQAARLGLLVSSVLHLARSVTRPVGAELSRPLRAVVAEAAAGTALADPDPVGAAAHAAAARRHASALQAAARDRADVVLADVALACVDDLQRVIELPSRQPSRRSG